MWFEFTKKLNLFLTFKNKTERVRAKIRLRLLLLLRMLVWCCVRNLMKMHQYFKFYVFKKKKRWKNLIQLSFVAMSLSKWKIFFNSIDMFRRCEAQGTLQKTHPTCRHLAWMQTWCKINFQIALGFFVGKTFFKSKFIVFDWNYVDFWKYIY